MVRGTLPVGRIGRLGEGWVAHLVLICVLCWRFVGEAAAQDPPPPEDASPASEPTSAAAQAREFYQRCVDLKTLRRYCKALEACEEGLEIYPRNATLRDLTADMEERCEEEEKKPTCGFGQVATVRSQWHCCWPGQSWDGDACDGMPSGCSQHFVLNESEERCDPKPCEAGMYHVDGVHCCWPGQRWSRSREHCIYSPRCPEGFEPFEDTCRVAGTCATGMVRVDKVHCCWPGQSWSQTGRVCNGTPRCPEGLSPWKGACEIDSDADGLPNDADSCPQIAAPDIPNGCPAPP